MKKTSRKIMAAMAIMMAVTVTSASAYSYDAWTTMTGDGTFVINPFVYAPTLDPFSLSADAVIAYGFAPNIDVIADLASVTIVPDFGYVSSWAMIRFDLGANNILALQVATDSVSPQYHFFWENEILAIELNLLARFFYADFSVPSFGAYSAFVLKLGGFSLFCEVNPGYVLNGDFALGIMPGAYINLGPAGQISAGVGLGDVLTGITPGVFLTYIFTIQTKK